MSAQHTPGPLTEAQLALRPYCPDCGWRRGGVDSWDGTRCKCGKSALTFAQMFDVANRHDAEAARLDALDMGEGDCEVAAAYHETRGSAIRAAIAKATGGQS